MCRRRCRCLDQPTDVHLRVDTRVREEDAHKATQAFVSFREAVQDYPNTIGHAAKKKGSTPTRGPRSRPTTPQVRTESTNANSSLSHAR